MAIRRTQSDPYQQTSRAAQVTLPAKIRELSASIVETVTPIVNNATAAIIALLSNYLLKTDAANTYSVLGHKHSAADITSGGTTGTGLTVGGNLGVNGSVSPTGNVSAAGTVSGTTGTFNTGLYSTGAYNTALSTSYRVAYVDSTGHFGYVSSPERFKTNIATASHDPAKLLQIQVRTYQYIAEVQERNRRAALDPTDPEYDADYQVATNLGVIAEELESLGLSDLVFYNDDGTTAGVRYELMGLLAVEAIQYVWGQVQTLQAQVASLVSGS